MKAGNIEDLFQLKKAGLRSLYPQIPRVDVGMATCGRARGANKIVEVLASERERKGVEVTIGHTGCLGLCGFEPMVHLTMPERPIVLYRNMTLHKSRQLIKDLKEQIIRPEWALCKISNHSFTQTDDRGYAEIPVSSELPIFKDQHRLALEHCGMINPLSIEEYVARGGYYTLFKALNTMTSEQVIEEVMLSDIKGRGGAGFNTGTKWFTASKKKAEQKFVICNADEGDPGAFKDRVLLESNPFRILEAMAIAGYAIGSWEGFIYLRYEYPHTLKILQDAIQAARDYGFIGNNLLRTGFNFTVSIIRGSGSYVCGEETALMDSVEGKIGDPRLRPPFPVERGLWNRPTIVNNVETFSNIPSIVQKGGTWYAEMGTAQSKGTKILSVTGHIKYPGLYEVPMGTPLRKVIFDMAGGPLQGKRLKAIQVGSPFGKLLPAHQWDVPLSIESLKGLGSMLGSGVLIAIDDSHSITNVIARLVDFFKKESCGKCVPCREGVFQLSDMVRRFQTGPVTEEEQLLLGDLAETMRGFSLCGMGAGAAGPAQMALRDFPEEFGRAA